MCFVSFVLILHISPLKSAKSKPSSYHPSVASGLYGLLFSGKTSDYGIIYICIYIYMYISYGMIII